MATGKPMVWRSALSVLALFFVLPGCGGREVPELAYVSGTVTMDGQPLPGVQVHFHPIDQEGMGVGRSGVGKTDSEGNYVLYYMEGIEGTKLGTNDVSIMTHWPDGEPGDGEYEKIPTRYYGKRTTLQEEVVEGENTFNFDLKSQ